MRIVFQRFLFLFARNQFRTASRVLIVSFLFSLLPVENCSAQLNNTRFVFTSRFPWNYLWLFQIRVPLVKKKISSYTRIVFQSLCSHFAHINLRFLSLFSFTKNCFPRVNHAFVISLPFRLAHVNYICYVSFLLSLWWKIVSYARTTFPLFLYIYFFFHPPPPPLLVKMWIAFLPFRVSIFPSKRRNALFSEMIVENRTVPRYGKPPLVMDRIGSIVVKPWRNRCSSLLYFDTPQGSAVLFDFQRDSIWQLIP